MKIKNNSSSAIDNIIVDNSKLDMSPVSPIIIGLSHHNAQILTFKHVSAITRFTFMSVSQRQHDVEEVINTQTHTSLHYKLL